ADADNRLPEGDEHAWLATFDWPVLKLAVFAAGDDMRGVKPRHRGKCPGQGPDELGVTAVGQSNEVGLQPTVSVRSRKQQRVGCAGAEGKKCDAGWVVGGKGS